MEKQKQQKIVFYTIYKENSNKDDLIPIKQFDTINQLQDFLQVPKKTIYNRLQDKKKIINQYIIYKDFIQDISI